MDVHTLYAVNVDTTGSDLFIDQISDFNVDTGIENFLLSADGNVDPNFVAVKDQQPVINFTTSALATALATAGISGLKIDANGGGNDGAEFWFQKVAEGGTRATGSNHFKLTMKEGILLPMTLNAPHNELASLEYQAVASWDGTNNPILLATGQALEGTAIVGEAYTAGPVDINGTTLAGIQDISIDFGLTPFVLGADGNVWPTFVAIQDRQPIITIRTLDVLSLNTFGLSGAAQGETDSIVYLRKIAEGGLRVADATETHISFTIDAGMIQVKSIGGSHNDAQMSEVTITPSYDGSNAIVLIDTTAAIA